MSFLQLLPPSCDALASPAKERGLKKKKTEDFVATPCLMMSGCGMHG
jgi:hypothetical protein